MQAIAEDFREATAELRFTADRNRPEALLVVEALRRGTEEDAALVEEFFSTEHARGAHLAWSRFIRAMGRQFAHEKLTGHHQAWRRWIPPR